MPVESGDLRSAGIISYKSVAEKYESVIVSQGARILNHQAVTSIHQEKNQWK